MAYHIKKYNPIERRVLTETVKARRQRNDIGSIYGKGWLSKNLVPSKMKVTQGYSQIQKKSRKKFDAGRTFPQEIKIFRVKGRVIKWGFQCT